MYTLGISKKMSFLLKCFDFFPREGLIGGSFKSLECISLRKFMYSLINIKEIRVKLMFIFTLQIEENEFSVHIIDESLGFL